MQGLGKRLIKHPFSCLPPLIVFVLVHEKIVRYISKLNKISHCTIYMGDFGDEKHFIPDKKHLNSI